MFTELAIGDVFVTRARGSLHLWRVVAGVSYPKDHRYYQPPEVIGDKAYTGVERPIVVGETIYRCVWKHNLLDVRLIHKVKPGDVTWESTGMKSMLPPHSEIWHNVLHKDLRP